MGICQEMNPSPWSTLPKEASTATGLLFLLTETPQNKTEQKGGAKTRVILLKILNAQDASSSTKTPSTSEMKKPLGLDGSLIPSLKGSMMFLERWLLQNCLSNKEPPKHLLSE